MTRTRTHVWANRLAIVVVSGVILGGMAHRGYSDQKVADDKSREMQRKKAGDDNRKLDVIQADYDKVFAALQTALPSNDANLKKLIALHAEKEKILTDRVAELKDEKDTIVARWKAEQREWKLCRNKLEGKIPQMDLLAFEQSKGKITAADRCQEKVRLNLGSADFVKPGLTFTVFGDGEYKADAVPKASIKVIEIIGEHKCTARVTVIKNAARRPIVPGDLLYNPMWHPGMRDRVAVIGRIDLNCDGRDGTAAFVKALEKEGVIVDAWIDRKDLSIQGARKTIRFQTDYLIIGEEPDVGAVPDGKPINPRMEKELTLIIQFREMAAMKGVSSVSARRYMALAGMKVPKAAP